MIKIYCLTKEIYVVIIHNILSDKLDPRLLGKIYSLTGVFYFFGDFAPIQKNI